MRKKLLTLALTGILAVTLCACGSSSGDSKKTTEKTTAKSTKKSTTEAKSEEQNETKYVLTKQVVTYEGGDSDGTVVTYTYTYNEDGAQMSMKEVGKDKDGNKLDDYGDNNYTLKKEDGVYKKYAEGEDTASGEYKFDKNGNRTEVIAYDDDGDVDTTTTYKYNDNGAVVSATTTDSEGNETRKLTYDNTDDYTTSFVISVAYDGTVERGYDKKYDKDKNTVTYTLSTGSEDYYPTKYVYTLHGKDGVEAVQQYNSDGDTAITATSKWSSKIGHIVESKTENSSGVTQTTVNTWEELK